MSVKYLSLGQMILCLEYILNDPGARKIVDGNDSLSLTVPLLKETLDALIASREMPQLGPLSSEQEKAIRGKLGALDGDFDQGNRLLFSLLDIAANHAGDEALRTSCGRLREDLFPYRLNIVQMKWEEEAAEAKRMEKQLEEPGVKDALSQISLTLGSQQVTAWDTARDIVTSGHQMGEWLVKLVGAEKASGATARSAARRLFFRKMNRFVVTLNDELEGQPEQIALVLKAYHESIDEAAKQKTAKDDDVPPDKTEETSPPDPAESSTAPAEPGPENPS